MDLFKARQIIAALADGTDPRSGEAFDVASPLESCDVVRALHVALAAIDRGIDRGNASQSPANAGKPWRHDDDQRLVRRFDSGQPVTEIASALQRTPVSIAARLVRLGKLPNRQAAFGAEGAPPRQFRN